MRSGIDDHVAGRFQVIGDPVLAVGQAILISQDQRTHLIVDIKNSLDGVCVETTGDDCRNARHGGFFGGGDFGRNPAGAKVALAYTIDAGFDSLDVVDQCDQMGVAMNARVAIVNPFDVAQNH